MRLSEQDVIIAGAASALVALVRKKWPKIDGGWVWVAMLVASATLAALFEVLPLLHPRVAAVTGVALGAITIVTGGKGALSQLAGAAQRKLGGEPPSPAVASPVAVTVDGAVLPPARDTESVAPVALTPPNTGVSDPPARPAPQLDFDDARAPR